MSPLPSTRVGLFRKEVVCGQRHLFGALEKVPPDLPSGGCREGRVVAACRQRPQQPPDTHPPTPAAARSHAHRRPQPQSWGHLAVEAPTTEWLGKPVWGGTVVCASPWPLLRSHVPTPSWGRVLCRGAGMGQVVRVRLLTYPPPAPEHMEGGEQWLRRWGGVTQPARSHLWAPGVSVLGAAAPSSQGKRSRQGWPRLPSSRAPWQSELLWGVLVRVWGSRQLVPSARL